MSQTAVEANPVHLGIARTLRAVLLNGRPFGQYHSPKADNFAWCPISTSHVHIKVTVTYNGPLREGVTKYDVKVELDYDHESNYLASVDIEGLLMSLLLCLETRSEDAPPDQFGHTAFQSTKPGHFQALLKTSSDQIAENTVITVALA
jgi:hypothetical protein